MVWYHHSHNHKLQCTEQGITHFGGPLFKQSLITKRMSGGASAARAGGFDRHITIFSPDGRLYQVEYAFKAINAESITSVAVRGPECAVLISPRKLPDASSLVDPTTVTHLYKITDAIGACVTGRVSDGIALISKARSEAAEYEYEYGVPVPPEVLARRLANVNQVATQKAAMRPLGVSITLAGVEEDGTVEVYRCDPAGYYVGYSAVATGPKASEVMAAFERHLKNEMSVAEGERLCFGGTVAETVALGVRILQESLGTAFKASELEIGLVPKADRVFRTYTESEVQAVLESIK